LHFHNIISSYVVTHRLYQRWIFHYLHNIRMPTLGASTLSRTFALNVCTSSYKLGCTSSRS